MRIVKENLDLLGLTNNAEIYHIATEKGYLSVTIIHDICTIYINWNSQDAENRPTIHVLGANLDHSFYCSTVEGITYGEFELYP